MHEPLHRFDDDAFGLDVHRTGRLVKTENGRVLKKSARYGNALPLASREAHAALADKGLVALWQAANELMHVGRLGGRDDVSFARVRTGVGDVLGDAARK